MILETSRLTIRRFQPDDAGFIVQLLNDPSFIRNIGDKDVHNLEEAHRYLRDGPIRSYELHGHGLWRIGLKDGDASIGMAGILKRDELDDVDLGYALLPEYRGRGYAFEATSAVMTHARNQLGFDRIAAIVSADNEASIRLLLKLGFVHERPIQFGDAAETLALYVSDD